MSSENLSPSTSGEVPRRNFLTKSLAVVIGGVVGLVPLASGLAVFFDPLRKRKSPDGESAGGKKGFIKVAELQSLTVGRPRREVVLDDRVEYWNQFPKDPVGAVYLLRKEDDSVIALNVDCPHAGCAVEFFPDQDPPVYQCPCHDSSFHVDGPLANQNSPAARGLDSLEVDSEMLAQGEVWVKFQKFRSGTAEKIVEEA